MVLNSKHITHFLSSDSILVVVLLIEVCIKLNQFYTKLGLCVAYRNKLKSTSIFYTKLGLCVAYINKLKSTSIFYNWGYRICNFLIDIGGTNRSTTKKGVRCVSDIITTHHIIWV